MQTIIPNPNISCEIRCMDPKAVEAAVQKLDPSGVEWVNYRCQISGNNESTLLIGDIFASKMLKTVAEAEDEKSMKIIAGLYSAELCECDVATLTRLPDEEVVHRLHKFTELGILAHRKIHGMNYYRLESETVRKKVEKALQTYS